MADGKQIALGVLRVLLTLVYTLYCILEALVLTFLPRNYRRRGIKGSVALVTGGASGIGRLMCQILAARGAVVVTWDVDEKGEEINNLLTTPIYIFKKNLILFFNIP